MPLHRHSSAFVLAVLCVTAPIAAAQEPMQKVKDLYAAAAYEDALSSLAALDPAGANADASQYRVFCFVALGRMQEADRAVESLLAAQPEYRLDPAQASPRIEALFSQVRRRIGPVLVKRMYQEGRAAMERKDRQGAVSSFEAMLRLANDADVRDDAALGELRDLGSGFLELSRAMPAPPPPAAHDAPAAPAAVARPSTIVAAVARQQRLPAWIPDPVGGRAREFHGSIRLQISEEGKVTHAEIVKTVHIAYDQQLLRAARSWIYDPATKDGVPIASEKLVEIAVNAPDKTRGTADKSRPARNN